MAALLSALLLLFAAKPHPPDRTKVEPFLARYRRQSGLAFKECPDLECVRRAETRCTPTHFQSSRLNENGATTVSDIFLERHQGRCQISLFDDLTADPDSGCRLMMMACSTVSAALSEEKNKGGCTGMELYRNVPCRHR